VLDLVENTEKQYIVSSYDMICVCFKNRYLMQFTKQ